MKKLFLILFVIASLNLDAQYVTNHVKNVNAKDSDGYYYQLPRNIIQIDFVIEKEQSFKGKYCSFAKEMLNTDNYIKENSTSFRIKDVIVNILTEADPNYIFYISASDEKTKENFNVNLELTSEGIIQSFGYNEYVAKDTDVIPHKEFISSDEEKEEYHYIPIIDDEEDVTTNYTEKEIAASIVNEIKNIRTAYFDLISGYQEVNYGTTINSMIEELKKLEKEYLEMFLGTKDTHEFIKTIYVIPEEGKSTLFLGKFSEIEGFNTKIGDNIKINFKDSSMGNNTNKLSKDDIENTSFINKLFYRTPANVTMQIMLADNLIFENRLKINQLGNLVLVPMNKMKLIFDTNTGQILSVIKE